MNIETIIDLKLKLFCFQFLMVQDKLLDQRLEKKIIYFLRF